jgi:hypothetical protein
MSPLTVSDVEYQSLQRPTGMSDIQSTNTSLPEVMVSSKHEQVFFRDLTYLTLQIIFDGWWASMNVLSNHPIARKNFRHAPSWHSYLHNGIEQSGSPRIICIV